MHLFNTLLSCLIGSLYCTIDFTGDNLFGYSQIEANGGQALTFGGDVSKEEDVEAMIKTVSKCNLC